MQVFGALVTPSPSMSTRAGKDILTKSPNNQGSLGTAISEAVELARMTPGCKYALGSVMSHVTLHQTVIGLEAEKQMEMAGEYLDIVIACFGGGSNFGGLCFPFLRHNISGERSTRFIAAEPSACPKLTKGRFEYDYGDVAGYTPLLPMYTLGHQFIPAPESCHAIAATIREAMKCKESGETKTILFCLSGHGLIDMTSYDQFLSGNMRDTV